MFVIKSYICIPDRKITNLDEANNDPNSFFVDIGNRNGVMQIAEQLDFDYLEGAIYMKYGELVILDFSFWDLVDQLWSYFLNAIAEILTSKEAETYFPDKPVKLLFKNFSEDSIVLRIEVAAETKLEYTLPKYDLINSLLDAAQYFFEKLNEYFKNNEYYLEEIKQIEDIRAMLKRENS